VALTAAALAGCGDTGGEEAAGGADRCGPQDGSTVVVEIPEFTFDPEPVAVRACDSVAWANVHDQAHTSTGDGTQRWTTGNLAPGDRSEPVRFEAPGSYSYLCALHPFMTGTVEVS
jgi:plastocyanin